MDAEPVAKAIGPGAGRQTDFSRTETVAAGGIDVHLGGDSQFLPGNIQADGVVERRHNFVVIGVDEKEGRRVGGRRNVIRSAGIDRRGKIGPVVRIMMKRDRRGDVTAGGEAKDADAILCEAPFGGARTHKAVDRTRK